MTLEDIFELLSSKIKCIDFSMENGLISSSFDCPKCGNSMHLNLENEFFTCGRRLNGTKCNVSNVKHSLYKDSFFYCSKLSLHILFRLMYFWSIEVTQEVCSRELDISEATVSLWYNKLRSVCLLSVAYNTRGKIGGPGTIVEIDECLISRRTYSQYSIMIWVSN